MRAKLQWLGILLLLTVVSLGGVAGFQHIQTRQAQQGANELEQRVAVSRGRIAELERERRRNEETENALRHSLLASTRPIPPPSAAARPEGPFDVNQMIAERPELRALYEANAKAAEMESYGWLIISLSPDAAERFRCERLQHDRQLSEIGKTSREQSWGRDDPRRQAVRHAEGERHAREMAAILDPALLKQYHDYEETLRARNYVTGELARELYFTDTPLSADQARTLTELVDRHGRDARGRFDFDAVNWDAVQHDAQAHLAPAQSARLTNLAEMRRLQAQVIAIERAFGARADGK